MDFLTVAHDHVIVVPIKAFADAKQRLSPTLQTSQRAELAASMAKHVLNQLADQHVVVVGNDAEVRALAVSCGASVLDDLGGGLNRALEGALSHLQKLGAVRATIVHADLPHATRLSGIIEPLRLGKRDVMLIPDRRGDGTNVLSIPLTQQFRLSYGVGSFRKHLDEASSLTRIQRLHPIVVLNRSFAHDVDVPADLKQDERAEGLGAT